MAALWCPAHNEKRNTWPDPRRLMTFQYRSPDSLGKRREPSIQHHETHWFQVAPLAAVTAKIPQTWLKSSMGSGHASAGIPGVDFHRLRLLGSPLFYQHPAKKT